MHVWGFPPPPLILLTFLPSTFLTILLLFSCLLLPLAVPMREVSCVGYRPRAWDLRSLLSMLNGPLYKPCTNKWWVTCWALEIMLFIRPPRGHGIGLIMLLFVRPTSGLGGRSRIKEFFILVHANIRYFVCVFDRSLLILLLHSSAISNDVGHVNTRDGAIFTDTILPSAIFLSNIPWCCVALLPCWVSRIKDNSCGVITLL